MGYYNDPEKTAEVISDGWLDTGDIAEIEENYLKIRGRMDGMMIRRGINVYPAEVENALLKDPRVKDVVVFEKNGMFLRVSGNFNSTEEVRNLCARVLPFYEIPEHIELVKDIPKTASGKVERN